MKTKQVCNNQLCFLCGFLIFTFGLIRLTHNEMKIWSMQTCSQVVNCVTDHFPTVQFMQPAQDFVGDRVIGLGNAYLYMSNSRMEFKILTYKVLNGIRPSFLEQLIVTYY